MKKKNETPLKRDNEKNKGHQTFGNEPAVKEPKDPQQPGLYEVSRDGKKAKSSAPDV